MTGLTNQSPEQQFEAALRLFLVQGCGFDRVETFPPEFLQMISADASEFDGEVLDRASWLAQRLYGVYEHHPGLRDFFTFEEWKEAVAGSLHVQTSTTSIRYQKNWSAGSHALSFAVLGKAGRPAIVVTPGNLKADPVKMTKAVAAALSVGMSAALLGVVSSPSAAVLASCKLFFDVVKELSAIYQDVVTTYRLSDAEHALLATIILTQSIRQREVVSGLDLNAQEKSKQHLACLPLDWTRLEYYADVARNGSMSKLLESPIFLTPTSYGRGGSGDRAKLTHDIAVANSTNEPPLPETGLYQLKEKWYRVRMPLKKTVYPLV